MHITHIVKNKKDIYYKADINTINHVCILYTATSEGYPRLQFIKTGTIDGVADVVLVLDGEYRLNKKRTVFEGDEIPHIFYITTGGQLYGGLLGSDMELFAETVISVSAVRGWSNALDLTDTQGLVLVYVKSDNKAYYQNYCKQVEGTYTWEEEREITRITNPVLNVSSFKTNDYRVGFSFQTSTNEVYWLITKRNWAGMAIGDEILTAGLKDLSITVYPITYYNVANTDTLSAGLSELSISVKWGLSPVPETASNPDAYSIIITFDHEISNVTGQQAGFTVTGENSIVFAVSATAFGIDNKTLVLTVNDFNNASGNLTVAYNSSNATIQGPAVALDNFSISFTPIGLVPTAKTPPVPTSIYNIE